VKLDNRGIHVSIVVVMLFQVCSLFIREFVRLRLNQSGMSDAEAKHLSALVGFAVLVILMFPVLRDIWPALRPLFAKPKNWVATVISASIIGCSIFAINIIILIWVATLPWLESLDGTEAAVFVSSFACSNPWILVLSISVMALLTPLFEETVNRGLFLHTLLPRGKWLAIFGSAVLFTVLHKDITDPFVFLFGIYAAVQILCWRNLWGVIVTHGVVNALGQTDIHCINNFWIPGDINPTIGGREQLSAIAVVSCLAGIYWLTVRLKVRTAINQAVPT